MKKMISTAIFVSVALLITCTNTEKKQPSTPAEADTPDSTTYPMPENYTVTDGLHTDTLIFKNFGMGDLAHFEFHDEAGKLYDFNAMQDLRYNLVADASEGSGEEGSYVANDYYVNKKFIVTWRTLKLKREPKDEMEFYYQEYNEVILLDLVEE